MGWGWGHGKMVGQLKRTCTIIWIGVHISNIHVKYVRCSCAHTCNHSIARGRDRGLTKEWQLTNIVRIASLKVSRRPYTKGTGQRVMKQDTKHPPLTSPHTDTFFFKLEHKSLCTGSGFPFQLSHCPDVPLCCLERNYSLKIRFHSFRTFI